MSNYSESQTSDENLFPPGTVLLSDKAHEHLVLAPQPTSDPNDPLNWSTRRKTVQMTILSFYAVYVYAFFTVSLPLWATWNAELGFSFATLNDSYAVSGVTLSTGCLLFTPFAMRYGRRPIYILTSLLIFAAVIWSAKIETVADLMLTNVIMGAAGSVNEALFQMTVNDMYFVHQRGTLNGVLLICETIGNYFGPVASGYIALSQDWRWVFWYLGLFQGVLSVIMFFVLEETKYIPDPKEPVVVPISNRENRANVVGPGSFLPSPLLDEKGNQVTESPIPEDVPRTSLVNLRYDPEIATAKRRLVEIDHSIPMRPWKQRLALITTNESLPVTYEWWRHLTQPFVLLFRFPAVTFTAMQWGFAIVALSVVNVSVADFFPLPPYNFSSVGVGNMNIPLAIGQILGTIWGGPAVDWSIVKLSQRNNGIYEPEFRLVLFSLPALVMPAGVMMYGLTTARGIAWIVPAVGCALVGFGIGGVGDVALTFLQDSYAEILPDALIGVAFLRNLFATILVFVLGPWFDGMGVYNAFVLLGCISVAVSLLGIPMYFYGKRARIRLAGRYRYYAGKQFTTRSL